MNGFLYKKNGKKQKRKKIIEKVKKSMHMKTLKFFDAIKKEVSTEWLTALIRF